jgi:hypothetical protein
VSPARFLPVLLIVLTGCVSTAPRIELPIKMEANCENRAVKQTAIESIVASTDDTVRSTIYPGDAVLHGVIGHVGGVFAYWKGQPLRMPATAKALGVSGDYVTLRRAVITNQIAHDSRPIWLSLASPKGEVVVLERAFDLQDVCIEGARDI